MTNKTVYFVASREISNDIPGGYVTGLKDIFIYKIVDNKPILIDEIVSKSDELGDYFKTATEEVQDHLDQSFPEYSEWDIEEL
jgi:hypothetical protein